jgi:hypothetical protein
MKIINRLLILTDDDINFNIFDIIKHYNIDFIDVIDYKWSFPYKLILLSECQDPVDQFKIFLTEGVGNKVKDFFKDKSIDPVNGLFKYRTDDLNQLFNQLNEICAITKPISWESIDSEECIFYEEIRNTKNNFNLVMYLQSDIFKLDKYDHNYISIINKTNDENNLEPENELIKAFQEYLFELKKRSTFDK